MFQIEVNGLPVQVPAGSSVIQACESSGVDVPRFCYESRLLVAGNCRMCLVEVVGSPKPQASCARPVTPNMKVFTDSPRVKKAREYVMEFLLLNHPLDCPICDQGGECDRQDQSRVFGSDRGRYYDAKRGVEDKDIGPLVKMVMTRCIHCTRCIRFSAEVAGVPLLGTSGRGTQTEVGTYVARLMPSPLSGNLTDFCPVGALTSMPMAFTYRAWEEHAPVDTVDATSSRRTPRRAKVIAGRRVRRLPLDGPWSQGLLDDKTRYSFDARYGGRWPRRTSPVGASSASPRSWAQASAHFRRLVGQASGVDVVLSPTVDRDTVLFWLACRREAQASGRSRSVSVLGGASVRTQELGLGVSWASLTSSERPDGAVLRVGRDPLTEAPLRNARLRQTYLQSTRRFFSVGESLALTFPVHQRGSSRSTVASLLRGDHELSSVFYGSSRPVVVLGSSLARREDGRARLSALRGLGVGTLSSRVDWTSLQARPLTARPVGPQDPRLPMYQRPSGGSSGRVAITVGVSPGELREHGRSLGARRRAYSGRVGWFSFVVPEVRSWTLAFPWPTSLEARGVYRRADGAWGATVPAVNVLGRSSEGVPRSIWSWALASRVGSPGGSSRGVDVTAGAGWSVTGPSSGWAASRRRTALPARHSYYTEGHDLARASVVMADCRAAFEAGPWQDAGFEVVEGNDHVLTSAPGDLPSEGLLSPSVKASIQALVTSSGEALPSTSVGG